MYVYVNLCRSAPPGYPVITEGPKIILNIKGHYRENKKSVL